VVKIKGEVRVIGKEVRKKTGKSNRKGCIMGAVRGG